MSGYSSRFEDLMNKNQWRVSLEQRCLTRREVLEQLKRLEDGKFSEIKKHCREFEQYMLSNYDFGPK